MVRRLFIPLLVVGSVAAGGVAGAMLGVPSLSGASSSTATQVKTANGRGGPARFGAGISGEFEAAAKALGLTPAQLKEKLSDGKTTIADVAAQQHVDLNKVIDAMVGADRQRIENIVNNPLPLGANGKNGMPAFGRAFGIGGEFRVAANALGMSPADLKQALRNGKTLAQIANDKHVDVNKVIDAMVADATKRIDDAHKSGKLSSAQADKVKSALKQDITALVNGQGPKFGGMGIGRGYGNRPQWAPPGP